MDYKDLKTTIDKKTEARGKSQALYEKVLEYKIPEQSVAALYRIGYLYQQFAEALESAPAPKHLNKESRMMYEDLVAQQVDSLTDQAQEFFKKAMGLASLNGINNTWTERIKEHYKSEIEAYGLERSSIQQVFAKHRSQFKYCYEQKLQNDPHVEGKIVVQFTIGEDGSVSKVDVVEDSTSDPEIGACIVKGIKKWVFEKPKTGMVVVRYPFLFKSK